MELKTVIFSPKHGSTFKWTGYKERNRNVKNPFYSNPYIHCPYDPPKNDARSRNSKAGVFRTQSQMNDLLRDLVKPKDKMTTTYRDESNKAWKSNNKILFSTNKPIMTCPDEMTKTNYHFSNQNYEVAKGNANNKNKVGRKNNMAQTLSPNQKSRSTFSSLGFQTQNLKPNMKSNITFIRISHFILL